MAVVIKSWLPSDEIPLDKFNFSFWVEVELGLDDSDGAEIFQFHFCSPSFLGRELKSKKYILGRHLIVVEEFNESDFKLIIEKLCAQADERGMDWDKLSEYLSRYGSWEFEDYKPFNEER